MIFIFHLLKPAGFDPYLLKGRGRMVIQFLIGGHRWDDWLANKLKGKIWSVSTDKQHSIFSSRTVSPLDSFERIFGKFVNNRYFKGLVMTSLGRYDSTIRKDWENQNTAFDACRSNDLVSFKFVMCAPDWRLTESFRFRRVRSWSIVVRICCYGLRISSSVLSRLYFDLRGVVGRPEPLLP